MTHVEQICIRADVYLCKYAGLFSCGEPRPITLAVTSVGSAFLTGNQMFKASSLRGSQNKIKVSKSQREIPDLLGFEEKLVSTEVHFHLTELRVRAKCSEIYCS